MTGLTLSALAKGLLQFEDRYQALDFFIADVPELASREEKVVTESLGELGTFEVVLYRDLGVARMSRKRASSGAVLGGLAGAVGGAALAKPSQAGGAALGGFLLGMLVGAVLNESANAPRRILAIRYDPSTCRWNGYDGGLVPYMKQWLADPRVIGDLPKAVGARKTGTGGA